MAILIILGTHHTQGGSLHPGNVTAHHTNWILHLRSV